MKQTERLTDPGSNPGCSTTSTLDDVRIKTVSGTIRSQCASDGADIGLDADMIKKVELPLGEGRNPSNLK